MKIIAIIIIIIKIVDNISILLFLVISFANKPWQITLLPHIQFILLLFYIIFLIVYSEIR